MEAGKVLRLGRGDSGLRTQTRSLIARGGRRGAGGKTRAGREAVSGASGGAALEAGHARVEVPVPDLVLQGHDHVHGGVEDPELGHRLVGLRVRVADAPQLLERVVDVPDPDPLPLVVGVPPALVLLGLLLRVHVGVLSVLGAVDGHIGHVRLGTGSLAF